MDIDLNKSVRNEYVPDIERLNRTTEERIRSVYKELIQVYGRVPGVIVRELVYAMAFWLIRFPDEYGISATLIPRAIITGQYVEFTKNCLLDFGEYSHTHEYGENAMEYRTLEALALCPIGDIQGGNLFLKLHIGRVIPRFTWTALPLPNRIRKLVRRLAQLPPIALEVLNGLQHEVPNYELDNDKDDKDYVPGEYNKNSNNDDDGGNEGGDDDIDPLQEPANINANDDDHADIILNPSGTEHDSPIAGVTTDQDQTVVNTDTAGEKAVTETKIVTDITGATDPLGVETPPTKEDSEQDNEDNANVTELNQK